MGKCCRHLTFILFYRLRYRKIAIVSIVSDYALSWELTWPTATRPRLSPLAWLRSLETRHDWHRALSLLPPTPATLPYFVSPLTPQHSSKYCMIFWNKDKTTGSFTINIPKILSFCCTIFRPKNTWQFSVAVLRKLHYAMKLWKIISLTLPIFSQCVTLDTHTPLPVQKRTRQSILGSVCLTLHFGKIWVNRRTSSCIILHHHLHPLPWPHSCPLPHLPLCFCLCHCHWEKQSLQLAVVIVLLLIRIRLISLLELGASGPSPLLGELPPSLLFITICSVVCRV